MLSMPCEITVTKTSWLSDDERENTFRVSLAHRRRYGWIEATVRHNSATGVTKVEANDNLKLSAQDRETLVRLVWQDHRNDANRLDAEDATNFIPTLEPWLYQRLCRLQAVKLLHALLDALGRRGVFVPAKPLRAK